MSQYYLIAQLPSLDFVADNQSLPISEERFNELCYAHLPKRLAKELEALTLMPPKDALKNSSALVSAWNKGERDLRLCLASARAKKLGKSCAEDAAFPDKLLDVTETAVELDDPMEAERFLNSYRLELLEGLRPADAFSDEMVFYYGLKLKLLCRMRRFDTAKGQAAYKNIYDSILNGKTSEEEQC